MWHIVTMFWFSVCVCLLAFDLCSQHFLSVGQLLSDCTSLQQCSVLWMTRVLHLICKAHTHILLFGSKFHIILAMYVYMLNTYIEKKIENIKNRIFSLFSKISRYFPTLTALVLTVLKTKKQNNTWQWRHKEGADRPGWHHQGWWQPNEINFCGWM